MSHKNIGSDFDDFMKGEGMSYCSICGNDHEGTACPSHYDQDMPIYDAGMDAIDELNAALAAKEAELAKARELAEEWEPVEPIKNVPRLSGRR
jgi:transcription elongation factor Elf1